MSSLHDGLLVCYSLFPKNSSVCSAEQTLQNFVALKDTVFPLLKLLFSLMMLLYFLFYFFFLSYMFLIFYLTMRIYALFLPLLSSSNGLFFFFFCSIYFFLIYHFYDGSDAKC